MIQSGRLIEKLIDFEKIGDGTERIAMIEFQVV